MKRRARQQLQDDVGPPPQQARPEGEPHPGLRRLARILARYAARQDAANDRAAEAESDVESGAVATQLSQYPTLPEGAHANRAGFGPGCPVSGFEALKPAPVAITRGKMREAYASARCKREKPPNIIEIGHLVQKAAYPGRLLPIKSVHKEDRQ